MLLPLYLLLVLQRSPSDAGLALVPFGLGALCSYPLMGTLTERFGLRAVAVSGATLALVGTLPFALFGAPGLPIVAVCAALFVRGVGMGCINIPSVAAAYAAIPKPMIPIATTALNIAQRLGGPVATTLLALCLHYGMQGHLAATPSAFIVTFWMLCAIHLATIVATLRLPVRQT